MSVAHYRGEGRLDEDWLEVVVARILSHTTP